MRHLRHLLASTAGLGLLASTASGQDAELTLRRGSPIIGNGNVTLFNEAVINNSGFMYTSVKSDHPDDDQVVLLNGFMVLVQGTSLPAPVGAFMLNVENGSMSVNNQGYLAWALNLGAASSGQDAGYYWNTLLVGQKGTKPFSDNVGGIPFSTKAEGADEDTFYEKLTQTFLNDHNEMLIMGKLQDEGFKGTEDFMSILTTDGQGGVTNEEFLAVKRYPMPGFGDEVKSITQSRVNADFNNNRDWIAQITMKSAGALLFKNGVPLYRSGDPFPLTPSYNLVSFTSMSLNNHGDFAFLYSNSAPNSNNEGIAFNGQAIVIEEGETFPDIFPHTVTRFDGAPVELADSGDIFWYCQTSNTVNAQDRVYIRSVFKGNDTWEHNVIVQEGVTIAAGSPVGDLRTTDTAFSVSDNGRFWVGEILLANSTEALMLADFGSSVPLHGCGDMNGNPVNQGTLQKVNGDPLIGATLTYEVDGDILPGTMPFLLWSTKPAIPGSDCGVRSGKKEILINTTPPQMFAKLVGAPYDGGPVPFTFALPLDPALVDMTIYAQAGITITNGRMRLTNAVEVAIGQPN